MSRQWIFLLVLVYCVALVFEPRLAGRFDVAGSAVTDASNLSIGSIGAVMLLAFGWLFGEEISLLLYVPAAIGSALEVLFNGIVHGHWPGEAAYFAAGNAGGFIATSWLIGLLAWACVLAFAWTIVRFAGDETD